MKVTKKTAKALATAKAAHVAKSNGAAVKMDVSKRKGAKKAKEAVKYNGIFGADMVLLLKGSKGEAFRRADVQKDGTCKLTQCIHKGIRYDGAVFNLAQMDKLNREQKRELGTYVAGKGSKAEIEVLTLSRARGMAKHKITVERHNGNEATMHVTRKDTQYAGSLERTKTGKELYGQWESKRLKHNKAHFGSIVKG